VFEKMIWSFNEYIFWIGRALPGALVAGVHVTALQAWLLFAIIVALLTLLSARRLVWLGVACGLTAGLAGTQVWATRRLAPDERFMVYSIPRRSVVGFWQGAAAHIVTLDSLPLNETERTYRIVPGIIEREARQVSYYAGWRASPVPARPAPGSGVVLSVWRGVRMAFVSGPLDAAQRPCPVDVVVLRRNAHVQPEELAAVFGTKPTIVFDSSCKLWYVEKLRPKLQVAGWQTHDVAQQGAYAQRPAASSP
jgi:competence protein ComEC